MSLALRPSSDVVTTAPPTYSMSSHAYGACPSLIDCLSAEGEHPASSSFAAIPVAATNLGASFLSLIQGGPSKPGYDYILVSL